MVKLSVIIVNYNTKDLVRQCLQSIFNSRFITNPPDGGLETIVVDNASKDGSEEMVKKEFPNVKLMNNAENVGFAKGNNLALRQTRGEFILLLNTDTVVGQDTLSVMVKYMDENPKVGVATCRVEIEDRRLDPACHRGFPTPWASLTYFLGLEKVFPNSKVFAQYHQTYKDLETIHEIDSPSGAFYLVRRKVVDEVGMLDEDFFMYGEDLDWSFRIKEAGWKIMYLPEVKIIHLKRQSGRENISLEEREKATDYFYQTMKLFYQKHYQKKYPLFISWLINLGIDIRWRLGGWK